MVEIFVINPKDRKRKIDCCACDMSYSIKDYAILFENEKLIYFKYKGPKEKSHKIYCHNCLLASIQKDYPFDEIPLTIIDDNYEYFCRYYTVESDNEDDSDFLSGLDDIFKK